MKCEGRGNIEKNLVLQIQPGSVQLDTRSRKKMSRGFGIQKRKILRRIQETDCTTLREDGKKLKGLRWENQRLKEIDKICRHTLKEQLPA